MAHYLIMPKKSQILALLELGWSYRRIEAETGVRRETVSRYDQTRSAHAAKTFAGSTPRARFAAAQYQTTIEEKLGEGLTVQRIWQDLGEEFGYAASYESVKRYVRTLAPTRRAVGVFHCAPGAEGQVDFFRGAPTWDAGVGEWRRPWVFRRTLGHSRHAYEEAVWDQKLETFLRLHEHAFRDLGGVPRVIRHDNLKAAVVRACFYDPDSHDVYLAFAAHWGFTPLPTRPRNPKENGKEERSGGYVKSNALAGRRFDSLEAHNALLRHWNRTVARLRIHGTTRRQVWTHFVEVERPALQPLAAESFPFFTAGERTVHTDGHIEVGSAFYPVPLALLGQRVRVRWDAHLVRIFDGDTLVAVHVRVAPGVFAPRPGEGEASTRQQAYVARLVGQCGRVGPALQQWAEAALAARGVRAIRLLQGVLGLTRRYPRERVLAAVTEALARQPFRYHTIRQWVERTPPVPAPPLTTTDPAIRPLSQYTVEDFLR